MDSVADFFKESEEGFIIYLVEYRFVIGRGKEYFKYYRNKPNYFDSQEKIETRIEKSLKWIQKKIPAAGQLLSFGLRSYSTKSINIQDLITTFTKVFGTLQHEAADPEIIDPIIIQEGKILQRTLAQIITLYKSSSIRPSIIILLEDNNLERAKDLLKDCPHDLNVKMIRNSGESYIYKVINIGTDNIPSFINCFSKQLFSSCSRTPRNVIYNEDWSNDNLIEKYSPLFLKIRSSLLLDYKYDVREDINVLFDGLNSVDESISMGDLHKSLLCMSYLFKVYCYDTGSNDMEKAHNLAKELGNDLLLAYVFRYADFFDNRDAATKKSMLLRAESLFKQNNVYDHAIYCKNNYIAKQLFDEIIYIDDFRNNVTDAVNNVPGLSGMSHLYNNLGVAYLFNGQPVEAIQEFEKGLAYCRDRHVPRLGLLVNILIAKDYYFQKIEEDEIESIVKSVFDSLVSLRTPFIASNYLLNCFALSIKSNRDFAMYLIEKYPIVNTINGAFDVTSLGKSIIANHIQILKENYNISEVFNFNFYHNGGILNSHGKKGLHITREHLNPIVFYTWL